MELNKMDCEMPYVNNEFTRYNPLHKELNLTLPNKIATYENRLSYNKFEITDTNGNKKVCFKKFITLVDYVKFLIGKYKTDNLEILPGNNNDNNTLFDEYVHSHNNYAYVDAFFYYLTSKLLENGFVHGLDYYDSYVCLTNNCEIDIVDDFEYLCDSNYFNEKLNTLFSFKDKNLGDFFNKKEPITIKDEDIALDFEQLDLDSDDLDNVIIDDIEIEVIDEHDSELESNNESNESDTDSEVVNDSESDNGSDYETETESNSGSNNGSTRGSETSNSKDEIEKLILIIKKIPTQVVAIENCENTFDSLLEDNITIEELESAMFQVIVMLHVYQNTFDFTHNDLHTNNIMYISTTEPFLYYKINNIFYKIPTFGKIYKIIDFGRAIYHVNKKIVCSDSFSVNGTAHTQYNCEPFYNKDKNIVEPNKSFDLCRLACSMIDFIIDDIKELEKFKEVPIYDLIISWIYDDNGINVLYKKNGEERYPDFKLYKMIARIVHNHIPVKQFSHPCFNKYVQESLQKYMDVDKLIKSLGHL